VQGHQARNLLLEAKTGLFDTHEVCAASGGGIAEQGIGGLQSRFRLAQGTGRQATPITQGSFPLQQEEGKTGLQGKMLKTIIENDDVVPSIGGSQDAGMAAATEKDRSYAAQQQGFVAGTGGRIVRKHGIGLLRWVRAITAADGGWVPGVALQVAEQSHRHRRFRAPSHVEIAHDNTRQGSG